MLSSSKLSLVFALTLIASSASAQVDSRFANWIGCWRLQDDLVGSNLRVCMTPEQATGLKMDTLVGAQKGVSEVMTPDNVSRPITDAECKGTEKSEWSKDGLRVFRYTDVTCGKETPRKLSSVSFLMLGPTFVQVQFVDSDLNKSVRVLRYRRAVDQKLADGTPAPQPSPARALAAPSADTPWDIDDVIEASAKLPADAVQAALTEVNGPFDLNKKTLVAMSNAKVNERVIDLMVALTYPKHLVINRAGSSSSGVSGISMGGGLYDPFMSPIIPGSAFYADCYLSYNSFYRSAYSSYNNCGPYYGLSAYSPYGLYGYGGNYYNNGGWVIVSPGPVPPTTAQPEGRAVKGFGYTQVQPREPLPMPRIGNGNGSGNATSGTAGANDGGNTNSGSSGATSGGYSGGSSGDTGRVAVPRPPGGY